MLTAGLTLRNVKSFSVKPAVFDY